jgi:hypothetical protein
MKYKQTQIELTATGIAPDLHRTSLLMALKAPTKIEAKVKELTKRKKEVVHMNCVDIRSRPSKNGNRTPSVWLT